MFSTLVVPFDGSELAERALPYAVRFAAERGGWLELVRCGGGPEAPDHPARYGCRLAV